MARRALDPEKREQEPYEYRLLLADGSVRWVLAHGQAVFETVERVVRAIRYVGTIQDITARHRTEAQLRDSESRLRLAIDAAKMAVWQYDVPGDKTTFSPELVKLFGFPDGSTPTVEDLRQRYLPGQQERVRAAGRSALERGEAYFEVEYQISRFDGAHRWMLLRGEIQLTADKTPSRVIGVVFDVTAQKKAAERQALLVDELNHRVRNTLSVVQSITKLTLRHARDIRQASADIEGRIMSLSSAHRLLSEANWEHVSLRKLAERVLAYAADRITVDGPDVLLRPRLAVDLSLVMHELLTNALKYGSLSAPDGRIEIQWSKQTAETFTLKWMERGGPTVKQPTKAGFGSSVIRNVLKDDGGTADMYFHPEGFLCKVTFKAAKDMPGDDLAP